MEYNDQNPFDDLFEIKEEVIIKYEDPPDSEVLEGSIQSHDSPPNEPDSVVICKEVPVDQFPVTPTLQYIKKTCSRSKTVLITPEPPIIPCKNPEQGSDQNITYIETTPKSSSLEKLKNVKVLSTTDAVNNKLLETVPDKYTECKICHLKLFNEKALDNHMLHCHTTKQLQTVPGKYPECEKCHLKLLNKKALSSHILYCHTTKTCSICKKEFKIQNYTRHWNTHYSSKTSILPPSSSIEAESPQHIESKEKIHVSSTPVQEEAYIIEQKDRPSSQEFENQIFLDDLIEVKEEKISLNDLPFSRELEIENQIFLDDLIEVKEEQISPNDLPISRELEFKEQINVDSTSLQEEELIIPDKDRPSSHEFKEQINVGSTSVQEEELIIADKDRPSSQESKEPINVYGTSVQEEELIIADKDRPSSQESKEPINVYGTSVQLEELIIADKDRPSSQESKEPINVYGTSVQEEELIIADKDRPSSQGEMATTSSDAIKKHSRSVCSFTGCGRSKARYPTLSFFTFPLNRPSICNDWIKNCANEALLKTTHKALSRRVVCEKHFEDSCFLSTLKTRLHVCAIPTILSLQGIDDAPRTVQGHMQVAQEDNPVKTISEKMQEPESEDSVQIASPLFMEVNEKTVMENNDQPLSQGEMATTSSDAIKKHSRSVCSFTGCGRSKARYPTLSFFTFPVNMPSICNDWIKNCANEDLFKATHKALNRRVVCEKHFEHSCFLSTLKTRLHVCAIPTILSLEDIDDAPRTVQGQMQVAQEDNPVQTISEQMQEPESEDSVQIASPLFMEVNEKTVIEKHDQPLSQESEDSVQIACPLFMEVNEKTVIENNDQPLSQDLEVLEGSIQLCDSPLNEPDSVVICKEVPLDQFPITPTIPHIKKTYSRSKAVSIKPEQGSDQNLTVIKTISKPPAMEKSINEKLISVIDDFNKKLLETVPDKTVECEICHLKLINQTVLSNHMLNCHTTTCPICKRVETRRWKHHCTGMTTSLPPSSSVEADCPQQIESEDAVQIAGGLFMDVEEETIYKHKDRPLIQEFKEQINVGSTSVQEEELLIKGKDRPSSQEFKEQNVNVGSTSLQEEELINEGKDRPSSQESDERILLHVTFEKEKKILIPGIETKNPPVDRVLGEMATTSFDAIKKHSGKLCSFIGCGRSKARYPTLRFYSFPVIRPSICNDWIKHCANKDLLKFTKKTLDKRVVCEKHFEDSCFLNTFKYRLRKNAIPTILSMPDTDDVSRTVQGDMQVAQEDNPVQTISEQMQEPDSVLEGSIQSCDSPLNEPDSVVICKEVPLDQFPITPTIPHIKKTYSRSKAVSIKPEQGSDQNLTGIKTISKPSAMEKSINEKLISAIDDFNKKLLETVPDKNVECEICHLKLINQTALSNHMLNCHTTTCPICKRVETQCWKHHCTGMTTSRPPSSSVEADCPQQRELENQLFLDDPIEVEEEKIKIKDSPISQELTRLYSNEIHFYPAPNQRVYSSRRKTVNGGVVTGKTEASNGDRTTCVKIVTAESGWSSNPDDVSKGKPPAVAVRKMILAKQWPYSCSPCSKYFVSNTALEKHVKKHMITKSSKTLNAMKNKPSSFKLQLAEKNECKSNKVKQCKSSNLTLGESQITGEIEMAQFKNGTSDCAHIEKDENVKVNEGYENGLRIRFECEFCPKVFKSKVCYVKHVSNHYNPIRRVTCSICGNHYKSEYDLKKHKRLVCNSGPKICNFCGKLFNSAMIFRKHTLRHLEHGMKEACKICNKVVQKRYLKNHITMVHNKRFQCKTCDKQFGTQPLLKEHEAIHSEQKQFKCKLCEKCFFTNTKLRYHISMHSKRFLCKHCGKSFSTLPLLQDHEAIHSEQKTFKCKVCQRCFFTDRRLRLHIRVHSKMFLCKHCGQSFHKPIQLLNHEREHERVGPFECEICGRPFKTIRSLQCHKQLRHSLQPKTHQCKFCHKRYGTPKHLKAHINQVHHYLVKNGPKPHVCDVCGKDFSFASVLLLHKAGHMKERKNKAGHMKERNNITGHMEESKRREKTKEVSEFICKVCNKRISSKAGLIAHEMIHTGEKPFHCHLCGKQFRQKPHLDIHLLVHSGKRPLVCDICGADYYLKCNLAHHIKLHLKNKA